MLILDPNAIDLSLLRQLWQGAPARLDDAALERVKAFGYEDFRDRLS